MQLRSLLLIAGLATPAVSVTTSAFADNDDQDANEKVVSFSDIPVPAQETIRGEAKGAPILKVETEEEGGKAVYEAHVKQGDEVIGIVVDAEGALLGKHSEEDE